MLHMVRYRNRNVSYLHKKDRMMQEIGNYVQCNKSEIASIREKIELEYRSAQLAMYGFAGVAQHEIISRKYDRMGELVEQLGVYVGKERAMQVLIRVLDGQ